MAPLQCGYNWLLNAWKADWESERNLLCNDWDQNGPLALRFTCRSRPLRQLSWNPEADK